ncbi:hypothetical protein D3C72_785150 [compost metagenome]
MGDQGLDVLQGALFGRRRGEGVIRLEGPLRHVLHALLYDAHALADLLDAHGGAIVSIPVAAHRHLELELIVAGIRAPFAHVEVEAGGPQTAPRGAPGERLRRVVGGDADGATAQYAVAHGGLFILHQALGQPAQQVVLDEAGPAGGQIVGHAADAEPGRVHAGARDGLDDGVDLLPVGEGEEDRGHGPHVLDIGAKEQQVALDAEQLRHHHPDHVDPVGYLDPRQLLDRQHIGQVVHHPAQVLDPVGVGDVAVPGLALAHLLGTAVVIADVGHAVADLFPVELQHQAEGAVGRGVVGAEVKEHVVLVLVATGHAPLFGLEQQVVLLLILLDRIEHEGIELGGAGRVVLAQRVSLPALGHHDAGEMGVTVEGDAHQIPDFPLVPVGVGEVAADGGQVQIALHQRHLQHHIGVTVDGDEVIEDGEVAARQAVAMAAHPLVGGAEIKQHHEGGGELLQEAHHVQQQIAGEPDHRHPGAGALHREALCTEVGKEFADHLGIGVIRRLPLGHGVVAWEFSSQFHGQISSGVRRLVTWMRSSRLRSFSACIWGR